MSTIIMSACWSLQMPPTPKAVLISLADNANDHGVCWPSIPKIAERTCFSTRAVINAIKVLEEMGILIADRSNGRHTTYCLKPEKYVKPVHEVHQCTSDTSEPNAPQPVHLRQDQCTSFQKPVHEVHSNRKEPSLEPSLNHQARQDKKSNPPRSRGERLPPGWTPSVDDIAYCKTKRPELNPDDVAENFRDYWTAKPGAGGVKLDWPATWRTWVRNEKPPAFKPEEKKPAVIWWASEQGILAKGREIGVNARPGEAMAEFRARINLKMQEVSS